MGDANRTQLAFVEETTWGTVPGTTFTKLRFTGESLAFNISNITSQEIRDDRQVTDLIQTGADCSGGINFELSYGAFDSLLEGLFMSDWVGVGGGSTESMVTNTTNTIVVNTTNKTLTLGAGLSHSIIRGQMIKVVTSGSDANDGIHFVTNVTGQVITIGNSTGLVTGTYDNSPTMTIKGAYLKNGTTEHYYSIERKVDMPTGDDYYFVFKGMMVNSMTLTASAAAIVTGSFEFIGKDSSPATGSFSSGAYNEASTGDVLNAVSNVGQILEGSSLAAMSGVYIQELSLTLSNNLRGLQAIGTLGNIDIGVGTIDVNGSINVYFANKDLYEKYVAATESGLSFKIKEGSSSAIAGAGYSFVFPRVKFATDQINAEGINTDLMERMTWQAIRHETYGYTAMVCRFAT